MVQAASAVLEQGGGRIGRCRHEEPVMLAQIQQRGGQEIHFLVEHAGIARRLNVVSRGIGQPGAVIRNAGAHAGACLWQPPVLHVALNELPRSRAEQMRARDVWTGGGQRHAIL